MNISVLVGSRDRPEDIVRCIDSMLNQNCGPMEVLVLDDNSSHCHLDQVLSAAFQDPRLRCFRSNTSLGVAGGRNFLMRQAKGDVFCVIDDDACFADSNALSHVVRAFESHPDVGILAFKIIDHRDGEVGLLVPFSQRWRRRCPNLTEQLNLVSYYLGGCHAIRRCVIDHCGNYQDDLVFGEEELDLSYRAIEAGFEIMYLPSIVAHHYPELSAVDQQERRRRLYYHVRNRFFLAYKYLPWTYIPVYLGIRLSICGLSTVKQFAFKEFFNGVLAGIRGLNKLNRTPLSQRSVQYLKTNYGRLWY